MFSKTYSDMSWDVLFYGVFDAEFEDLPEAVQDELLAHT